MSRAWSGNISTDDPATCIQDVQIWAPNALTQVPFPPDVKLQILSLVEVAQIPLYLAAGPSCGVSTGNEATTRWLMETFLNYEEFDLHEDAPREPWWLQLGGQSENGILLKVESLNEEQREPSDAVTEVLLYAAAAKTEPTLPTPPVSSSPTPHDEHVQNTLDDGGRTLKVFALPLCSKFLGAARKSMAMHPSTTSELQSVGQACFLPYMHDPARVIQPAPQKRQSISKLFEDATQKRRKLKGRGGESVSQAMAGIDRLPLQQGIQEKQEIAQPRQNNSRRKSLTRPSSTIPVAGAEHPRPTSGSGPLANGKRSSLHRVESMISPRNSPTPSDADSSYMLQNKAALTKVVMAAMRLHGLQQKKKPPSKSQLQNTVTLHTETNGTANEAEDEFKFVYHQTLKAAMFTFRKHLNAMLISQETMRDIVDRLLTIFCTDPMIIDRVPNDTDFPELEANNGHPSSSPFDRPSSHARYSNVANGWNTPVVKKR